MLENRKVADDERNFALRELLHQMIAMRVLAVEDGEISPAAAGSVNAFEFVGHPGRFVFGGFHFDDADSFRLRICWLAELF